MLLISKPCFIMDLMKHNKIKGLRRINSMNNTMTILSQFQSLFSRSVFEKLSKEHRTDKNVRTFSTWNLLTVMLYAHVSIRKSFRDICINLQSMKKRWYHLGLVSISRNNLSNSLAKRSSQVFEKMFLHLVQKVTSEKNGNHSKKFKFKNPLYAIDSTTISLCIALFCWASFRSTKAGIKAHTMYDIKNGIPSFMSITEAKCHDHNALHEMPFKKGDIVALDRAYLCLKTLQNINKIGAFFVTRSKSNTLYRVIKKMDVTGKGIQADNIIKFTGVKSHEYPGHLRMVRYINQDDGNEYVFITNNFTLSAKTIADIYKSRWEIELFFKWIKQNLRIKNFFGTSENAVRIQIWTAAIAYLLTEYIRFLSKTSYSLAQTFRIIGSNIFERRCIFRLLSEPPDIARHKYFRLDLQLDLGF